MGKIHFKLKFYNLGYDMFLKKKKVYENFSFFTNKQTHARRGEGMGVYKYNNFIF